MQLFQEDKLPVCTDGRLSAGPLDLPAFLAQVQAFPPPPHPCFHWPPCSLPFYNGLLRALAQQPQ